MAAIDLRAAILPTCYTYTAASNTWQEFQLPPRCRVTVTPEGAGLIGFARNGDPASPEQPADAGAVGTHREKLRANLPWTFRMTPDSKNHGQSIFTAGDGGTPVITVVLEHCES